MNALIIAQYFPPDMGGASARAFNVAKGLFLKGCDVTVVAAFPHYPHGEVPSDYKHNAIRTERVENIKVLRVWIPALPHNSVVNRILLHLSFTFSALFALPFTGEVDVIWAANPNLFSFLPALIYKLAKRKPIVRNVDDLWPEVFYEMGIVKSKPAKMALDLLARLSYMIPEAITPISPGYKRRIVERYGVNDQKIRVVEVGIHSAQPPVSDSNKNPKFLAVYSGVLGIGYDFSAVLKAARSLSEHKDIVFLIRGTGERELELKQLVGSLGLENVMLKTDFLPRQELAALLRSADVFLLPMSPASFVEEGLPAKVFEYQSYGKPIVCISDGEPARYIEATHSGLVVKQKDADGLKQAILKLYNNRKLALELGENGRRHVSLNMTAEKIGERMYGIFKSIQPE
jgi:glycosyltransferase involved in cell wall biosynthesis